MRVKWIFWVTYILPALLLSFIDVCMPSHSANYSSGIYFVLKVFDCDILCAITWCDSGSVITTGNHLLQSHRAPHFVHSLDHTGEGLTLLPWWWFHWLGSSLRWRMSWRQVVFVELEKNSQKPNNCIRVRTGRREEKDFEWAKSWHDGTLQLSRHRNRYLF